MDIKTPQRKRIYSSSMATNVRLSSAAPITSSLAEKEAENSSLSLLTEKSQIVSLNLAWAAKLKMK